MVYNVFNQREWDSIDKEDSQSTIVVYCDSIVLKGQRGKEIIIKYGKNIEVRGLSGLTITGNCTGTLFGVCENITLAGNADMTVRGGCKVKVTENAKVTLFGRSVAETFDNAKIIAFGRPIVIVHSCAELELHDFTCVLLKKEIKNIRSMSKRSSIIKGF